MSRVVVASMLVLSFSTGVLDAATFLGLHGVFTANMTGNVIFVSLGLAGEGSVAWQRALLALGGFTLGAAAAGLLGRRRATRQGSTTSAVLALVMVALLLGTTAVTLAVDVHDDRVLDASTVALALAMGVQALAARWVGVGDVTTVVVTSTLAALAGENAVTGATASGAVTARRALAVGTMVLGAVAGAFLLQLSVVAALAVSCALVLGVALAVALDARSISRVPGAPRRRALLESAKGGD